MENNHDIDKKFNEASQTSEEPSTFPGFDKVWTKVEEKLDHKENKKRLLPIWIPYGIAASLLIGFGAFYFLDKKETTPSPIIAKTTPKEIENPSILKIDSTIISNIKEEQANPNVSSEPKLAFEKPRVNVPPLVNRVVIEPKVLPPPDINDVKNIEEVAIMAYGVKRSVSYTTSSSVVKSTSAKKMASPSRSVASLSGKVAGVAVTSSPGVAPSVSIRGMRSLDGKSNPMVIVDGKIAENSILDNIDPNLIKSINVLKGNSATAIYGEKAVNGLLIIETKDISRAEKRKLKKLLKEKGIENVEAFKDDFKIEEEEIKEPEPTKAGLLTAGEVNDFSKWNYWTDMAAPSLAQYKKEWQFSPENRISVQLVNKDKKPVVGEKVKLLNHKKLVIWEAVSDNLGNAELWINPFGKNENTSTTYFLADYTGQVVSKHLKEFKEGQNLIILNRNCVTSRALDIAFVVDATGSMGDEISYLKTELLDVLKKVESQLKSTQVRYGSVFYRDQGDDYVTRKFDFSDKAEDLINFIKDQNANGGGDTPEAVVEALQVSIDNLKWTDKNATKILFLILDAPPHQTQANIDELSKKIKEAAKKGITIIPLAASDTDKQTEYLMRTFALLTNGTYTFLTNDSGIGNNHIAPTIDSYEVEKLNDLLLRLILQRATLPKCESGISNDFINKKLETESNAQPVTKVSLYPNPTKGMVNIKSKNPIDEVIVYDLAGKIIVRKENLLASQTSVDLTAYPQSIYLVRIRIKDQWETYKVIKN